MIYSPIRSPINRVIRSAMSRGTNVVSALWTVLTSAGASYSVPRTVLNSAGASYSVPATVLSSTGASYTPI